MSWLDQDPPVDPLPAIKAKAQAQRQAFETARDILIDAYHKAEGPKARLKALAAVMEQHAEFIGGNLFTGDAGHAMEGFARQVRKVAGDL